MREAVIVSTARTPIGKAFRGAFNNTHGARLGGHVVEAAIARAEPASCRHLRIPPLNGGIHLNLLSDFLGPPQASS